MKVLTTRWSPPVLLAVIVGACIGGEPGDESSELARYAFSNSSPPLPPQPTRDDAMAVLAPQVADGESIADILILPLSAQGTWLLAAAAAGPDDVRRVAATADGQAVDYEATLATERQVYRDAFGKLSPAAFSVASLAATDAKLAVDISFTGDFVLMDVAVEAAKAGINPMVHEYEALIAAHRATQRARIAAAKAEVLAWLSGPAGNGTTVTDYPNLPMIKLVAPPAVVLAGELHEAINVVRIDLHEESGGELLGYAGHAAMNEGDLSGGLCGGVCTGAGTNVALWEQDTSFGAEPAGIATLNLRYNSDPANYMNALASCTQHSDCAGPDNNQGRCVGNLCRTEHVSYVAAMVGMIGSYSQRNSNFSSRAGTHDVDFYVANDSGPAGFDWAVGQPVVYLNRSQDVVGIQLNSQIDWAARYDNLLATVACGNTGTAGVVCAKNWNTIGVTHYRYEVWNNRADDRRYYDASYLNNDAVISGLERPHMFGPGSYRDSEGLHAPDIASTGSGMRTKAYNNSEIVGSSLASPAILSMAIQAHTYEGWLSYLGLPIMRKAVLLAASVDGNADGQVCKGDVWVNSPDGEDGAGTPHGLYIKQTLDNNRYSYLSLTNASFVSCGSNCREVVVAAVSIGLGKSIKVALVYNSCAPTRAGYATLLNDLDLVVVRSTACGGGSRSSVNLNSETEMVYHSCGTVDGGTMTVKIRIKNGAALQLCGSESNEPVAVAWSIQ